MGDDGTRKSSKAGSRNTHPTVSRRSALVSVGALATGLAGSGDGEPSRLPTDAKPSVSSDDPDFDPMTWQSDAPGVPDRPLYQLSLPGTHHAAMYGPVHDWWHTQTRDVYTQLCDGIRYLDVRVESQGNGADTVFYGHHGGAGDSDDAIAKTGASLDDEVIPDIRRFLEAVDERGASEFVLLALSKFWDSGLFSDDAFEADDWRALEALLSDELGDYVLDLGSTPSDQLLGSTLAEFDGPKVAILYDGGSRPSFAGEFGRFVRSGWLNEVRPGRLFTDAVDHAHTDVSRFGELQWLVTPDPETILTSGFDSTYDSLREGAERTNALLPGYARHVENTPGLNPNVLTVDYYETSEVVTICRELSIAGLHGGVIDDTPPVDDDVYRIESVRSGRVADVERGSTENDANVQLWEQNGTGAQRFRFVRNADRTYRIENVDSGKAVEISRSGTDNGDNVAQWPWNGSDTQRWYVVALADDEYVLLNANSGRALDASGTDAGSNVHQWHWHSRANQRWRLDTVVTFGRGTRDDSAERPRPE